MRGCITRRSRALLVATALLLLPAAFARSGFAQHVETSTFNASPVRPKEDPKLVARGKSVYEASCQSCHAADLRGGSGPSLLRSQPALTDKKGENIIAIIQGNDKNYPQHKIAISMDDSAAVVAYVHTILAQIGSQGRPPGDGQHKINTLVGDAARGKTYFAAKCASCHQADGDMKTFAKQVPDPKNMQVAWIRGTHLGKPTPTITATVTPASGKAVSGTLIHVDDFFVTIQLADGTQRTFRRNGDLPKVAIKDPLQPHRDLLPIYADTDIHDITAYLVTLK